MIPLTQTQPQYIHCPPGERPDIKNVDLSQDHLGIHIKKTKQNKTKIKRVVACRVLSALVSNFWKGMTDSKNSQYSGACVCVCVDDTSGN